MLRYLFIAVVGLLIPLLSSVQCLNTLAPNPPFVPPAPYPSSAPGGQFCYWALTAVGTCETTC